jgi:hypothetical protein
MVVTNELAVLLATHGCAFGFPVYILHCIQQYNLPA